MSTTTKKVNTTNKQKKSTPAPVAPSKKVPAMVVVNEDHRKYINELVEEFNLKNTKEAFELIVTVAKANRFTPDLSIPGEEMTHDTFSEAASRIANTRTSKKNTNRLERLRAQIAELEKLEKSLTA